MKKKTSVGMADVGDLIERLDDRQCLVFALWCAERVRHLMSDPRSTAVLDVAARHLRGEATDEELDAAWNAAWDAAFTKPASFEAWAAWAAPLPVARKLSDAVARGALRASWVESWAGRATARDAAQATARDAARAMGLAAYTAHVWANSLRGARVEEAAAQVAELAAQHAELRRMLGEKINPASSKKKGRKK